MPPTNPFEGYIRPRVCGLIVEQERLLLVKINAPTRPEPFWMPPGGGIDFQEPAKTAVVRECAEETGLRVEAGELCFISEYISGKWHALEWYFRCKIIAQETLQTPKLGHDPEMPPENQMLEDIAWFTADEIRNAQHVVFPEFIREHVSEILSGQTLPLRFVAQ